MDQPQQRKDSVLSPDVAREVQNHHRTLKQFIDVSFDSSASIRKNSKRATKAREKLLKLSQAQFVELSTDVYDELQRRINESKEEPDHLLPKGTFHPKRNQAREKLASLPAQRFKDLVNDILYEIERRDLHRVVSYNDHNNNNGYYEPHDERVASVDSKGTATSGTAQGNGAAAAAAAAAAAPTGVQSKTVIPTKATMAWSSDEEEQEEEEEEQEPAHGTEEDFNEPPRPQSFERTPEQFNERRRDMEDADEFQDTVPEMNSPSHNKHISNASSIKRGLSINKDREIQMLLEEGGKMDSKITELEAQLEKERQKNFDLEQKLNNTLDDHRTQVSLLQQQLGNAPNRNEFILLKSQYDALNSSHAIISDKHDTVLDQLDAVTKERDAALAASSRSEQTRDLNTSNFRVTGAVSDETVAKIQEQIANLSLIDTQSKSIDDNNNNSNNNSDHAESVWKSKFEDLLSEKYVTKLNIADISDSAFQDYISDNGGISFRALADFQASVESFYSAFGTTGITKADQSQVLKAVENVAKKADAMCITEDKTTSLVRSCITHSIIVAGAYAASGGNVLPPVTLNIAINDLVVTVSDLIKSVKLLSSNKEKSFTNNKNTIMNQKQDNQDKQQQQEQQAISTPNISTHEFAVPGSFANRDDTASPVRPFKMVERLNSPNPATAANNGNGKFDANDKKSLAMTSSSPLAPINTEVANATDNVNGNGDVKISSPRGPGIISLASKYGTNSNSSNGKRSSPTSQNILDRIKKFDSPEPSVESSSMHPIKREEARRSISDVSANAFEKFGANRRSVSKDNNINSESTEEQPNTNVDLNEIPDSNTDADTDAVTANSTIESSSNFDKATAAANFKVDEFNIANPDNTLHELSLYLEHQTVAVISTIQTLLASIKQQDSTRGALRDRAKAINDVVGQMTEATNTSMSQTRNVQLREHGTWVVQNLEDCGRRMDILCGGVHNSMASDSDYADKNFKQRLAGVAFDIAKSTKELVKSVEEASLKQEIEVLDAKLSQ